MQVQNIYKCTLKIYSKNPKCFRVGAEQERNCFSVIFDKIVDNLALYIVSNVIMARAEFE